MGKPLDQIIAAYQQRYTAQKPALDAGFLFRAYINGDIGVAVAELDTNEQAAIANLANQGLEQFALRVASTMPDPRCPAARPGIKVSEERAQKRRHAVLGWWDDNIMEEVLTVRAMDLLAYGSCPVSVLPDPLTGIPRWQVQSPLATFPAPLASPVDIVPRDCILTFEHDYGWLKDCYPAGALRLQEPGQPQIGPDTACIVLRYVSASEIVVAASLSSVDTWQFAGQATRGAVTAVSNPASAWVEVDRIANKAGRPLVFVPGWSTIVGRRGRLNGTIGAHQMRAKLLALAYITAVRGAQPEEWIEPIDQNSGEPEVLQYPDPLTGAPGRIANGRIREIATNPGFMTSPMLSILEREIRLEGGIPADFGGESPSAVRTGRRGDAVLASAIDFPIQRAQRLLSRSLSEESCAAINVVKSWTPGPKQFYVSWKGADRWVDYNPVVDFDTDQVNVKYSLAGSDLNNDLLRNQSKIGTNIISKQTGRENDPEIPDAQAEGDRVRGEQLEELGFAWLQQQVSQGVMTVDDLVTLWENVKNDTKELLPALAAAHRNAQQAQAAALAQPPPPTSPDAQQGINPTPPIPQPVQGLANLAQFQKLTRSVSAA